MNFSLRSGGEPSLNHLAVRLQELRDAGVHIADLTESNPTRARIPYPPGLLAPLGNDDGLCYEPHPFGMAVAREAVAAEYHRRGARVDASAIVLAASTSEAYAWLFKLLCDPGTTVMVPRPSYPLFEHLTRLEGVHAEFYPLEYHGRWTIDFAPLVAAPAGTRAVVVVSPNNPTGSYVSHEEFCRLAALCADRQWALSADEVFVDYPLAAPSPLTDLAAQRPPALTFTLGGLSKAVGLPQLKLAWILTGGPDGLRQRALARLELIADSFLSVGTPVQLAAPALLSSGRLVGEAIRARVADNLHTLQVLTAATPSCELLHVEGGWSGVIRVPAVRSEDEIVLALLERERILVHPGYFFDFPNEAYVVVSLLPPPDVFRDAAARLMRLASS